MMRGKKQIEVDSLACGDIGVTARLVDTNTNDTLTTLAEDVKYAPIVFPKAYMTRAIVPTTKGDEDKISGGIAKLLEENPTLAYENNAELKQPAAMRDNPDYVEAFVPIGTNDEVVYDSDGNKAAEYAIVYTKADKYTAGNKYLCFIGGDQPLTKIHNESINDGSSIVVIKESYGNAFVPFLVDSYEYVYVIDYRKWSGHLADFVVENGIDDVLFLNVVSNTSTPERLRELSTIIQ
jgi:hypothetical protein